MSHTGKQLVISRRPSSTATRLMTHFVLTSSHYMAYYASCSVVPARKSPVAVLP